ncbi:hypothetical protein SULAZ_0321 [Sulfurihydrogenibium azorense Az-Fu1]|uniref:Uncharacterized protein n=1 Tax=Sulfurihydrogenibium azorense (strain DSM 15241 / OCM 825 / Az-Fu1) TaxID=204536 RepID=C1DT78_SULAA|nr:hypothetical protein SULAZ_0321 [Sulfurihydrogenibium azorense Az-Fu1]
MEFWKIIPAMIIMVFFTGLYFIVGVKFIKKWRKKDGSN